MLEGGIATGLLPPRVESGLIAGAKKHRIPYRKAFEELTFEQQKHLLFGGDDIAAGKTHNSFQGLLGLLDEWRSSFATENFRSWLTRFMSPAPCSSCNGRRLRRESLAVRLAELSIADFASLPARKALEVAQNLELTEREKTSGWPHRRRDPAAHPFPAGCRPRLSQSRPLRRDAFRG